MQSLQPIRASREEEMETQTAHFLTVTEEGVAHRHRLGGVFAILVLGPSNMISKVVIPLSLLILYYKLRVRFPFFISQKENKRTIFQLIICFSDSESLRLWHQNCYFQIVTIGTAVPVKKFSPCPKWFVRNI